MKPTMIWRHIALLCLVGTLATPTASLAQAQQPQPGEAAVYPFAPGPEALAAPESAAPPAVDPWNVRPGLADLERPTGCCEKCGYGVCCPEEWYFENGVRVLARNAPRYQPLVYDGLLGNNVVFNGKDLHYGISAGYTGTLGRYLGRTSFDYDEYGEVSFWGLNQWSHSDEVHAAGHATNGSFTATFGSLYTPFNPLIGGFNRVDSVRFDLEHRVNNVELNYWLRPRAQSDQMVLEPNGRWIRQCRPGWYWAHMIGLRAMFIEDNLGMYTSGQIDYSDPDADPGSVSGSYRVDANNTLLGFQVGGDLSYRHCRWSLGTRYSVAPFINLAEQHSQITSNGTADPLSTGNFNLERSCDDAVAAAALNLGFTASYRILPHLVLRGAYDLMWVPGVALAPDQLDFTQSPDLPSTALAKLNTGGMLFYQGLTLSADLTW